MAGVAPAEYSNRINGLKEPQILKTMRLKCKELGQELTDDQIIAVLDTFVWMNETLHKLPQRS